jgi:Glycosyl hydrolases family 16
MIILCVSCLLLDRLLSIFLLDHLQIDWQPTALTFSIDGTVVRTIQESDTVVDGVSQYPNTPSRIQLRCAGLLLVF